MQWWHWGLLIVSPIDLLPDWVLGPIGFIDDIFYFYMMRKKLSEPGEVPPAPVRARAAPALEPPGSLVSDLAEDAARAAVNVVAAAVDLTPDDRSRLFHRVRKRVRAELANGRTP